MDHHVEVTNGRRRLRSSSRLLSSTKQDADSDNRSFLQYLKHGRKSHDADSDYRSFIQYLKLGVKLKNRRAYDSCDANDRRRSLRSSTKQDADPDYRSFLQHLKLGSRDYVPDAKIDNSDRLKNIKVDSCNHNAFIDQDYQLFLKHLRGEKNGRAVERGEEEEGDIKEEKVSVKETLEIRVKIEDPEEENYPSRPPINESRRPTVAVPSCYMEKLTSILEKTFDKSEYDKLMAVATARTPVRKLKHLRSDSKSYATNQMGRSLIDHYPSLADLIKSADCQVGLFLLRGFFFWLKNMTHDGAFMPWLVATSGSTLPSGSVNSMLTPQIEILDD